LCDFELSHFLNVQLPVTCSVERLGVTFYAVMLLHDQVIRISPLFLHCVLHNLIQAPSKCKPANGISHCQTLIVVHLGAVTTYRSFAITVSQFKIYDFSGETFKGFEVL
jgi:hypothetical protein